MENEAVKFLMEITRVKSFSGEEEEVAGIIREEMDELGFEKTGVDEVGNVWGLIRGKSDSYLMFEGHMDTVKPGRVENWVFPPFSGKVVDGEIYGRGAADMKGSIAAMIYSASEIKEPEKGLICAFVVHEEDQEGFGIRHFLKNTGIKPEIVVLGEPTNLNIAIGHRGRAEIVVKIRGRTGHSSMPHLGENALLKTCSKILKLKNIPLPENKELGSASITPVSVNCSPGEIPITPDYCEILLDRRIVPGESKQSIIDELENFLQVKAEVRKKIIKCYTGFKEKVDCYFPAFYIRRNEIKMLSKKLGAKLITWKFGTDGSYTAGVKEILTFGYGPGEEEMAHVPNEKLNLKKFMKSISGYKKIFSFLSTL